MQTEVDLNFLLCHSASPCPELTLPPRALLREGDTEKDGFNIEQPIPTPKPAPGTHRQLRWAHLAQDLPAP